MSREKLREAIEACGNWVYDSDDELTVALTYKLERVFAAARAYACERCFGIGEVCTSERGESTLAGDGWRLVTTSWGDCPDCAIFRKIADGGE